jgi:hypothetical protein
MLHIQIIIFCNAFCEGTTAKLLKPDNFHSFTLWQFQVGHYCAKPLDILY